MFNQFIPLVNVAIINTYGGSSPLFTLNVASVQNLHLMDHEASHNEFFWTRSQSIFKKKTNFATLSLYQGTDLVACMLVYTSGSKVRVERIEVRDKHGAQMSLVAFFVFTAIAEMAATNVGYAVMLRGVHMSNWLWCKILGYKCAPGCSSPCKAPCSSTSVCADLSK